MEKKEWKVSDLDKIVSELREAKDAIKDLKDEQKKWNDMAAGCEARLLEYFEETGKTQHVGVDAKVHVRETMSFKTPKTRDDKEKFFNYLKEKGEDIYWGLATVNSQTLNAFCKQELQIANDNKVFPFTVPGIEDPTSYKKVIIKNN